MYYSESASDYMIIKENNRQSRTNLIIKERKFKCKYNSLRKGTIIPIYFTFMDIIKIQYGYILISF